MTTPQILNEMLEYATGKLNMVRSLVYFAAVDYAILVVYGDISTIASNTIMKSSTNPTVSRLKGEGFEYV